MKYKCNSYLDSYEYGKMALVFTNRMWLSFSIYASSYNVILCIIIFFLTKNLIDAVGSFIIIELVILILFRIKIREVAKIFYKIYLKKSESNYELEFYIQPYIEGYDRDFNSLNHIPIRFRNSGSSYDPFNIVFMRMYRKMKQIDDVNDYGHQIHAEEYLFNQNKVKKLTK